MRSVHALRVVSGLEGLSYLLLVFVAMPLKYGFDMPLAVRFAGGGHGWLFLGFVAALAWASWRRGWSPLRAVVLFGLSIVPFGFLFIDRALREEIARAGDAPAPEDGGERATGGPATETAACSSDRAR